MSLPSVTSARGANCTAAAAHGGVHIGLLPGANGHVWYAAGPAPPIRLLGAYDTILTTRSTAAGRAGTYRGLTHKSNQKRVGRAGNM